MSRQMGPQASGVACTKDPTQPDAPALCLALCLSWTGCLVGGGEGSQGVGGTWGRSGRGWVPFCPFSFWELPKLPKYFTKRIKPVTNLLSL